MLLSTPTSSVISPLTLSSPLSDRPYSPLSLVPHTNLFNVAPHLLPHHLPRRILLPQRPPHGMVQCFPVDGGALPLTSELLGDPEPISRYISSVISLNHNPHRHPLRPQTPPSTKPLEEDFAKDFVLREKRRMGDEEN